MRRQAFGHMVQSCTALGDFMVARGPSAAHDMDELLLRAAMDVIGAPPAARREAGSSHAHSLPDTCAGSILHLPLLRAAMDVIGPLGGCQPAGRLAAPMRNPCSTHVQAPVCICSASAICRAVGRLPGKFHA